MDESKKKKDNESYIITHVYSNSKEMQNQIFVTNSNIKNEHQKTCIGLLHYSAFHYFKHERKKIFFFFHIWEVRSSKLVWHQVVSGNDGVCVKEQAPDERESRRGTGMVSVNTAKPLSRHMFSGNRLNDRVRSPTRPTFQLL